MARTFDVIPKYTSFCKVERGPFALGNFHFPCLKPMAQKTPLLTQYHRQANLFIEPTCANARWALMHRLASVCLSVRLSVTGQKFTGQ